MQPGMIGLGRMGGNMTECCLQRGHDLVVYDHQAEVVARYVTKGAVGASAVEDLVSKLQPPRAIWLMLPAGAITAAVVTQLGELCSAGDIIIG